MILEGTGMMMMMMMGCVPPWLSGETGYVACREGDEQRTATGGGRGVGVRSGGGVGKGQEA